ncbi:MAG: DMT family transporter [Acidimicrobiales bacterium]|jgi:hypothetical protein
MVIFLALLASLANAIASICQRLGVEDAPQKNGPSIGLVRHMLQRRIWLIGFGIMSLGYASQATALHLGTLNLVQPLMVSEMVILVMILWLWYFTPLRARDLLAACATAIGLGVFLFVASPSAGKRIPSNGMWLGAGLATLVVVAVFVALGSRGPEWRRALMLGTGASIGFALLAAITKSMTNVLVAGFGGLFTSWQLYALCVVGLGSFLIMQSAFQVGPFAVSQSALILVNPFVSIAVGHLLFGESLRGGAAHVTLEVLSLLVMIGGALLVSASPLVAQVHDETEGQHLLKGRGRYAQWVARR